MRDSGAFPFSTHYSIALIVETIGAVAAATVRPGTMNKREESFTLFAPPRVSATLL